MRLRSLELSNFRAFPVDNEPISLDHDAVLLYGRNGVGKTAFFDAIELALTGTIRRLNAIKELGSVLVNVRNESTPATVRIVANGSSITQKGRAEIQSHELNVEPFFDADQATLFQYTAYLQQFDIRRLIAADSASLGDIIRSLAVSGEIEKLDRALSEASLTRQNRAYTSAVKALDEKRVNAERLREQILADERSLNEIAGVDAAISRSAIEVEAIALKLNISTAKRSENADDVRVALESLDSVVQPALKQAISKRAEAERRLRVGERLLEEQEQLSSARDKGKRSNQLNKLQLVFTSAMEDANSCAKELANPVFDSVRDERQTPMATLLESALSLTESDVCPVCDRPYADLKSHIKGKLKDLLETRSKLQVQYSELQQRLKQRQEDQRRAQDEVLTLDQGSKLVEVRFLAFQREVSEFLAPYEPGSITLEDAVGKERRSHEEANREIESLSSIAARLSSVRSELEAVAIRSRRTSETLTDARNKLAGLLPSIATAERTKRALDEYLATAQEVRKRTSEGIEKILQSFAMGTTRENFEDLFKRLTRAPLFGVTISDARVIRRRPDVRWCATYREKQYPGEAIFSQGELNACAIAFFLALATSNPQALGFLVLDDPVQNMDEIHIEELGAILKFIKDQLGWQLIIGLHDESIYQYLKRQLYPCKREQSLAGYVLEMTNSGTEISQDVLTQFDPKAFIAAEVA